MTEESVVLPPVRCVHDGPCPCCADDRTDGDCECVEGCEQMCGGKPSPATRGDILSITATFVEDERGMSRCEFCDAKTPEDELDSCPECTFERLCFKCQVPTVHGCERDLVKLCPLSMKELTVIFRARLLVMTDVQRIEWIEKIQICPRCGNDNHYANNECVCCFIDDNDE